MALLLLLIGDNHAVLPCMPSGQARLLGGMAPMYLLMAVFHLPAWIRMVGSATDRT
jgi:hypothetical protein